jgi:predicted alpha/beta superfamily hydrolase
VWSPSQVRWQAYAETHEGNTVVGDLRACWVPAPELGGKREVLCLLPPGAETSGWRYPVVYMLDGQNLFDDAASYAGEWRVDETMAVLADEGRQAIIVGITNGGDARLAEYTPYPSSRRGPAGAGRGQATLAFITDKLKPLIDAAFPTRAERTATMIAGSSLGGLMSLYAGWERPDVFGAVAAFSPAFLPGQRVIVTRIGATPRPDSRVYLDTGGREGHDLRLDRILPLWSWSFRHDVRRCRDALVRAGFRDGVDLRYVEDRHAVHSEAAWAERLPDALRFLLGPLS